MDKFRALTEITAEMGHNKLTKGNILSLFKAASKELFPTLLDALGIPIDSIKRTIALVLQLETVLTGTVEEVQKLKDEVFPPLPPTDVVLQ